jgi:type VI secretion system protein ImpA
LVPLDWVITSWGGLEEASLLLKIALVVPALLSPSVYVPLAPIALGLRVISTYAPTGDSLRYEGTYDLVASLRRQDDPDLEQGVWKTDLKKADWSGVERICLDALETRSKDIQIAAWLLEAWIHLHGFAGLREGLHLVAELCDTYWDGIPPDAVDGDLDYRLAPIHWIDEKLSIAVKLVPVTHPDSDDLPAYSLAEWEMARRRKAPEPRGSASRGEREVTHARFQQSASLTLIVWAAAAATDVRGAQGALDELVAVLDARCGSQSPGFARMREALGSVLHLLSTAFEGRENPPAPPAIDDSPIVAIAPMAADAGSNGNGANPIRTRAEAYQRLAEAADFLARIEPHSPVPSLIRKAIKWGGMTLEELLPELVRDSGQLTEIYRMLQLGQKPQP